MCLLSCLWYDDTTKLRIITVILSPKKEKFEIPRRGGRGCPAGRRCQGGTRTAAGSAGRYADRAQAIADELALKTGIFVRVAGREAEMALKGAMTTPGAGTPLAILDLLGLLYMVSGKSAASKSNFNRKS